MATRVKDMSVEDLREMIQDTVRETLEDYIEDLKALGSQPYLESIAQAREEYRAGQAVPLESLLDG